MFDPTFMMYAAACEGDFTVGKSTLDAIAEVLAYNWVTLDSNPNNPNVCRAACNIFNVNFDSLLNEEIDYLSRKIEEEAKYYGSRL